MTEETFEEHGIQVTISRREDGFHTITLARGSAAMVYVAKDMTSIHDLRYLLENQSKVARKSIAKLAARLFLKSIGRVE